MIKKLFIKKKKFQPISIFLMIRKRLIRALSYKGIEIKEIVRSKWTFPISMADCIPRTFLVG